LTNIIQNKREKIMKTALRTILASSVIAIAATVSSVHAEGSAPAEDMEMAKNFMQTAQAYVQSAVGGEGNILVSLDGDVATLIGFADNALIKQKAEQAALKDERVTAVRNHVVTSN